MKSSKAKVPESNTGICYQKPHSFRRLEIHQMLAETGLEEMVTLYFWSCSVTLNVYFWQETKLRTSKAWKHPDLVIEK